MCMSNKKQFNMILTLKSVLPLLLTLQKNITQVSMVKGPTEWRFIIHVII